VLWIAGGFGSMQVLRFASSIILAHLLYPQAFGLFALTYVFITALHLFSDLGIRVSIIQSPRGEDPAFLDTAWTIQVIRGVIIWLVGCALAWPAAYLRPEPEPALLWLLPVVAFCAVIEGFISTNLHLLFRHLKQRTAVLIESISAAGGITVTVCWALFIERSLWAMAAGPLTNSMLQLILSHLLPGHRNRFRRDRHAMKELVHFGRWIFLSTMFTFLADQSDRLVVGFLSVTLLGVYHLANQIATVPVALMSTVARQIVLPLYSRLIESGKEIGPALREMQVRAGAMTALMIAGLISVGPTFVRCLYDERYQDATWILPLLAVAIMLQIFDNFASSVLIAIGKPRIYALSNFIKVICLVLFMPLGVWLDGLRGLIIALILGEVGRYLCTAIFLRRDGLPILRRDCGWAIFAVAVGVGTNRLVELVGPALPAGGRNWPVLLERMAMESALVIILWAGVVGYGWRAGWFHKLPGQDGGTSSRF